RASLFGAANRGARAGPGRKIRRQSQPSRIQTDHQGGCGLRAQGGSAMKQSWEQISRRFDTLRPRERVMVFMAGVAIIAGLGFVLAIDGALAKHKILVASVDKHRT